MEFDQPGQLTGDAGTGAGILWSGPGRRGGYRLRIVAKAWRRHSETLFGGIRAQPGPKYVVVDFSEGKNLTTTGTLLGRTGSVFPVTTLIAIPLLYGAWQRRKSRNRAANDPGRDVSRGTMRAMRQKDFAFAVFVVSFTAAAMLGTVRFGVVYWMPFAVIAVASFVCMYVLEGRIAKGIGEE